jgi:hypothetical protein
VASGQVRDPFEVLGISPRSSEREVVRAFRALALELHPDVNPGDPGAEERFKEVLSAFEAARAISRGEWPRSRPHRRPAGPAAPPRPAPRMRERYVCTRCDDTFPVLDCCPRCELPLFDSASGRPPPPPPADPRVETLTRALLARRPPRAITDPRHALALAAVGCGFGAYEISIGLVPMGVVLIACGLLAAARVIAPAPAQPTSA